MKKEKRKKLHLEKVLFTLLLVILMACAGGAGVNSSVNIADIQDKDWALAELRSASGIVQIDRTRPDAAASYTLRFEAERLSGGAAPNRYFGPYDSGPGNSLSIGLVGSTLMAAIFEHPNLREQDYFAYLNRVNHWELKNGVLELYTSDENGTELVLVYR